MTGNEGKHPNHKSNADAEIYRKAGVEPPWERVWRDGVDVTDQPELWPELWANPKRYRRRRR
jgi:hypothetical protein